MTQFVGTFLSAERLPRLKFGFKHILHFLIFLSVSVSVSTSVSSSVNTPLVRREQSVKTKSTVQRILYINKRANNQVNKCPAF